MNTIHSTAQSAVEPVRGHSAPAEPVLCTLPEFIKVPPVPGLPTAMTGAALRTALLARAQSKVTPRRE